MDKKEILKIDFFSKKSFYFVPQNYWCAKISAFSFGERYEYKIRKFN